MTVQFKKKTLNKYGLCGGVTKSKPLFSKKEDGSIAWVFKVNLNKQQGIWNNVLWTDETK